MHCTPFEAVRGIHVDIQSKHTLASHFASFAGSDAEALEPIVELEAAKEPNEESKNTIGDWNEEGGFGWIDVGATAEIPFNFTPK